MKKRFSEEQIIGFLREAEAGLPIKRLALPQALVSPRLAPIMPGKPVCPRGCP